MKKKEEEKMYLVLLGCNFLVLLVVAKIVIKNPDATGIIAIGLIIVASGVFFIPSIRSGIKRKKRLEEIKEKRKKITKNI